MRAPAEVALAGLCPTRFEMNARRASHGKHGCRHIGTLMRHVDKPRGVNVMPYHLTTGIVFAPSGDVTAIAIACSLAADAPPASARPAPILSPRWYTRPRGVNAATTMTCRLISLLLTGALATLPAGRTAAAADEPVPGPATSAAALASQTADAIEEAVDTADPAAAEGRTFVVTSTADAGPGSLRQAIVEANASPGADTITFDPVVFADPQTISLDTQLPEITGVLTIDGYIQDRLWRATGVTVSGAGRLPVLRVAPGGRLTLRSLTVADACAVAGGAITNLGELAVNGVTFRDNESAADGGAVLNLGGSLALINSTFARNRAADRGGAFANIGGLATVTNCTFSNNAAPDGGALFSDGELLLRNTILANSEGGADCVAIWIHPASTHNLIESGDGCGTPIMEAAPRLQALGSYNGPTVTFPIGGGSPAINLGDNAAAVDENGLPLVWDQRGNGDPRFVAGYTDIGAFEHQGFPHLTVDTIEDVVLRACTRAAAGDCPLRAAIELANAAGAPQTISFDPGVFAAPTFVTVGRPLPTITSDITLDATGSGGVTLAPGGDFHLFEEPPGEELHLIGVTLPEQVQDPPGD